MKKVLVLMLALLFLLMAGCSSPVSFKDGGIEIKGEDGETIKITEDGMEFTDEDGSKSVISTGESLELPRDYPTKVLPVLKGGNIVWSTKSENNNKSTFSIMAEYDKKASEVYNYYINLSEGMDRNTFETPEYYSLSYEIDDYSVSVVVMGDSEPDTQTTLSITLAEQ